ncbi:prion-like-(Q/N-rich) domain-bearing protein 25 [Ochlerotatus camptorhynchus]|uniref:prion-like-(Q/N-rich) domain-bearing protein 25 n=1 Tax=Ochlerotatus camptorhynchus TaxID=644619 RepID=UPI0031D64435
MLSGSRPHTRIYDNGLLLVQLTTLAFFVTSSVLPTVLGQTFVRRTASVCRTDSECPSNAYCEHYTPPTGFGVCSCLQGHFMLTHNYTRECLRFATAIGDFCQYDDQCQYLLSTDSECRANSCQCREGTHYVERERRCYKTSYLGQYCRLTNNCIGDDTYCRDGVCVCAVGKHPNAGRNLCLPDVYLGETCFRDEECITEHSRCNNVCRCRVSHILNREQNQCLPIAGKLYDLCEVDLQCLYNIPHSRCQIATTPIGESVGNCTCANGYHEIGYKCYPSVYLNGICEVDENCAINQDTVCINGRCRCADHMVEVDGQCSTATKHLLYTVQIIVLLGISQIL